MKRFFPAAWLRAVRPDPVGLRPGLRPDSEPTVEAVAVAVTEARTGTLTATSRASGQLSPIRSVYITAKVPGKVVAVHQQMGDAVQEGDLLAELDDKDLASQLAAAQAPVHPGRGPAGRGGPAGLPAGDAPGAGRGLPQPGASRSAPS